MQDAALNAPWSPQSDPVPVAKRGRDLIRDPLLNKGTAFRVDERERFRLHGLLPSRQITMDQQVRRTVASIDRAATPLDMYLKLSALQDRNEHLYFRVLAEHLDRYMPIIYTPTVAEATRNFSQVFRRARGAWLTPDFRGRMARVLRNAAGDEPVRLIVATDNESILGIGDQGAGGMAICVGKLALYTVAAGIPPAATLPISLDVGTDNPALLSDEMYVGWREPRLRGTEYDDFIDEFVEAVASVFPKALLQWEDLRKDIALGVADRYRARLPSFNDDIQGTGAVALAGLLSSVRVTGTRLAEHRVVVHGAGAAGLGIVRQIRAAMRLEGLSEAQSLERVAALDSRGLLVADQEQAEVYKRDLAWPPAFARSLGLGAGDARGLAAVVTAFRPTALVGTSGQRGSFTEAIVRSMASHCARPVILPMSNPSDLSEAVPEDLIRWTDGRALVASGSPFAPVELNGRTINIGQGNNVLVFPGLGLGILLGGIRTVTDEMLTAAAYTLAGKVSDAELAGGMLFPAVTRLREISAAVAAAVISNSRGGAVTDPPAAVLVEAVQKHMWVPRYEEYVAAAADAAEGPVGPVALCALAVAGLLLAEYRGAPAGVWIAKPVASASFIWAALASGALATTYGMLVLAGLALCMLGDVLLIPGDRPRAFRGGVFAFLLGHVAYGAAFLTQPLASIGLVGGGVLLALVVGRVLRWLGRRLPADMVVPVRAYMVVIGAMATLACGVTGAGGAWQVAVGALAFTASDIAVARDRFVTSAFLNRLWGLPLYYGAQLLIAATPALVR